MCLRVCARARTTLNTRPLANTSRAVTSASTSGRQQGKRTGAKGETGANSMGRHLKSHGLVRARRKVALKSISASVSTHPCSQSLVLSVRAGTLPTELPQGPCVRQDSRSHHYPPIDPQWALANGPTGQVLPGGACLQDIKQHSGAAQLALY